MILKLISDNKNLKIKKNNFFKVLRYRYRGGVEDARLEAKTKDTKKIRGQGQPFRGQTLSMPRTGMLEAKDQGHSRKCSPKKKKKKGLQKSFSVNLKFIGVGRIFDWGGPNHMQLRHQKFSKESFLWDKDIVGWKT